MYETSDLHKRIQRYEAAVDELRAAHLNIRNVLHDQVLFERWQQIGAELGFTLDQLPVAGQHGQQPLGQQHDLTALNQQIPQISESWSS